MACDCKLAPIISSDFKSLKIHRGFFNSSGTMGILGLSKLIADVAPGSIKENEMKNYFGRKVAIDASMSLYQVGCN